MTGKGRSSTAASNAEGRLRRGEMLNPPRSLPYHALARTCRQCGALVTTPDARLRKDAGPIPTCPYCQRATVKRHRQARAADPNFKRQQRAHTDDLLRRSQVETLDRATRTGYLWTSAELEIAARPDLTAREAAKMLGRTLYAVKRARTRIHKDPKWAKAVGLGRDQG